jgi:hypothetical protein
VESWFGRNRCSDLTSAIAELKKTGWPKAVDMTAQSAGRKKAKP